MSSSELNGTARTVKQLFTGRKYGVEYYQREYTWAESNVVELLNDLTDRFYDAFDEDDEPEEVSSYRSYFLGPIVTNQVDGIHSLVDGQQRLTTLMLLLIHLDHISEDEEGVENLEPLVFSQRFDKKTFNINVEERKEVMQGILERSDFDPTDKSESVRKIWNRYQNVIKPFSELDGKALVYFIYWLLERVVLVEIETTSHGMALEVFVTMNDRGVRLSSTDMVKSFLLSRMETKQQIDDANRLWRRRITEAI